MRTTTEFEIDVGLPLEQSVLRFVALHSSSWQSIVTGRPLGTKLLVTNNVATLRLCRDVSDIYSFLRALWEQFSLFTTVGHNLTTPVWRSDTSPTEWNEGGYLFADWLTQHAWNTDITIDVDVVAAFAGLSLSVLWNKHLQWIRESVTPAVFKRRMARLVNGVLDELSLSGKMPAPDEERFRGFFNDTC